MITTFETGAIFKILDEATPTLTKILRQVNALNQAVERVKANLTTLSGGVLANIGSAAGETQALANAWREVATASAAATRSIGTAATANRRAIAAGSGATFFGGGGGGGRRGGGGGGRHGGGGTGFFGGMNRGNLHMSSIGTRMPGGHMYFRGGNNAMMAGAGAIGFAAYEEAQMEDAQAQLRYHFELMNTAANNEKLRGILQRTHTLTGAPMKEIVEAALTDARMMKGTPGGGLDTLEELLKGAGTEARLKGSGLPESMNALIGLAHMTKTFDAAGIQKLIPTFAMLSSANPDKLAQIERASSYALPTLQSGLGVDPGMALLAATVLRRGGATSSKGGTWLRELAERSMPSSSSMSEKDRIKHDALLEKAGLRKDGKALNLSADGTLDLLKTLQLVADKVKGMSPTERGGLEKALYGERGKGALNILGSVGSMEQLASLWKMLQDKGYIARSSNFLSTLNQESPVQQYRTSLAAFQDAMTNLGTVVLPSVTGALQDFKGAIEFIKGLIPHPDEKTPGADKWKVGTRALEGAGIGAVVGSVIPGIGTIAGAGIGAGVGGILGLVEGFNATKAAADQAIMPLSSYNSNVVITGNSAAQSVGGIMALKDALQGLGSTASSAAGAANGAAGALKGGTVFPGGASKMNFLQGPSQGGHKSGGVTTAKVYMKKKFVGTMTASIVEQANGPIQGMVYADATRRQVRNDHSHATA